MIVVEGPDGAGKTTLIRRLMNDFPELRLGERGTTDRTKLYEVTVSDTHKALADAVYGRGGSIKIWDRLFYSEFVYAELVGRPIEFNECQQIHVMRVIEALKCPVILCLPPLLDVRVNMMKEEQMDGVLSNIDSIYEQYAGPIQEMMPDDTIVYDYTRASVAPTYADICHEVSDYIDNRRERTW